MSIPIEAIAALTAASGAQAPSAAQSVSADEVERFNQIMESGAGSGLEPAEIKPAEALTAQEPLGQVFMNAVENTWQANNSHLAEINTLAAHASEGTEGMQKLFQIQYEMMKISFEQDLTTKVADKISQGVQTLFRNQ